MSLIQDENRWMEERGRDMDGHTPGPWRVLGSVTTTKQGTHNLHIGHGDADTFSPMLAEVLSDGDRLPKEANARLIAAAPDLLAACEDLLIVAEESGADTLAQIRARAAIKKARGE